MPEPPEIVSHDADDEIVHAHVDDVVMVMVPVPPAAGAATRAGVTANVHDGLGCVTTKLLPAIVSVTLRGPVVVFAAAVKNMPPDPVRFAPFEIVTHDAPLVALHVQLAFVVTVTLPLPLVAFRARLSGEMTYEHGATGCVTVKVRPPTVRVPVRETVPVFAATV